MFRRKTQAIDGHTLPSPRLTKAGLGGLLLYVAVPMMAFLTVLDIVFYLIFRFLFQSCYGVLCLF